MKTAIPTMQTTVTTPSTATIPSTATTPSNSRLTAILMTAVLASAITACGSDSKSSNSDTQPANNFEGIWIAEAYGEAIRVEGKKMTQYQFTQDYCLVSNRDDDFSESDIRSMNIVLNTTQQPNTIRQHITNHGVDYRGAVFSKQDVLPETCETPYEESNIELEFSWFSQLFTDYYPTFSERNIDWQSVTQSNASGLSNSSSINELLFAMDKSIEVLRDDHVSIQIADQEIQYSRAESTPEQILIREFITANGTINSEEKYQQALNYLEQQMNLMNAIRLSYAADDDKVESSENDKMTWYITDDNIGVIIIEGMEGYSTDEIADINYLATLMPQIIDDLQDTRGLIIDVRNNTGGYDSVSQIIARHFLDNERDLYRKQARIGSGRTDAETYRLAPANTTYIKHTVLLTSGKTVSAAEVFTLMMRGLPQVTIMGETTQGAISDVLEKQLPSGIEVNLVNEYYTTLDGDLFEVSGIPVDQHIPFASADQRSNQKDDGIEAAVTYLLNH